jgi:hypothetical protein
MELLIKRTYFEDGTNGELYVNENLQCYSIELPWLKNERRKSCIPEGTYPVEKRTSEHFGKHLWIKDVPKRDLILIHAANDALKELLGCIAPVTKLTGHGKGIKSKTQLNTLVKQVYEAIDRGEDVFITIEKA